jgi:hypothetical protein
LAAGAERRRRVGAAAVVVLTIAAVIVPAWSQEIPIPPLPVPTTTTTSAEPPPTEPPPTSAPAPTPPITEPPAAPPLETPPPETLLPPSEVAPVVPPLATEASPTTAPPTSVPSRTRSRAVMVNAVSPAAVTGSFGVGLASVVGFAFVLIVFAVRVRQGGPRVLNASRNRLYLGIGLLALAGVVGLVGYLKLSLEPEVNRQIPYLASAGMALVLLSAAGGALIVGEQLRADDRRIEELEAAVLALSATLAPTVEAPPRRDAPALLEADEADRDELAESQATKVVTHTSVGTKPRRRRS